MSQVNCRCGKHMFQQAGDTCLWCGWDRALYLATWQRLLAAAAHALRA